MSAIEHAQQRYQDNVDEVVSRLEYAVAAFKREARVHDTGGVTGTPRYSDAAHEALHALTWGIANANAHRIVRSAAMADLAESNADPAPQETPHGT